MDQLLVDYIAYYAARMKRYEGNPLYANSFASEKALRDALASCGKLEEFRAKLEADNLSVKNAIALAKDKAAAENKHYHDLEELIRAQASDEILQTIDKAQTALDVTNICSDAETRGVRAITIDELHDTFTSYLIHLENIEVYRHAEVPEEWKGEQEESAREAEQLFRDQVEAERKNHHAWQAGWKLDTNRLWEARHRRKIALPDDSLKQRIAEFEKLAGS